MFLKTLKVEIINMNKGCVFCNIVDRKESATIIYENETTIAFLPHNPIENKHTLVIPKKHVKNFLECDLETINEVMKTKQYISQIYYEESDGKCDFNFLNNCGEKAFQTIFHYHEHIIPKLKKDKGFYIGKY